MSSPSRARRLTLPWLVAWSCFAVYLGAARQVGSFFPLSVFDMYQGQAPDVVARVLAVDASGQVHELHRFEGFVCEPAAWRLDRRELARQCGDDHRPLPYVLRDQQQWIDDHRDRSGAAESITIISRAHVLEDRPGAPAARDCVLVRCTATRRGAAP